MSDIKLLTEASKGTNTPEFFKRKTSEDLAEKIIELAENEQLRLKLAQDAKIYAEENFSIEAHIAGLKKLYESTI